MVSRTKKPVICIDCIKEGVVNYRPTPHGGPRSPLCVSHNRARKKSTSERAHERKLDKNFKITAEEYQAIKDSQDGKCFICRKATGATKRLAVEHEHNMEGCEHDPENGCAQCIRALCCGRCNELVAFLDADALARAIILLTDPPARKLLRQLRGENTCPGCEEPPCDIHDGEPTAIPATIDVEIREGGLAGQFATVVDATTGLSEREWGFGTGEQIRDQMLEVFAAAGYEPGPDMPEPEPVVDEIPANHDNAGVAVLYVDLAKQPFIRPVYQNPYVPTEFD